MAATSIGRLPSTLLLMPIVLPLGLLFLLLLIVCMMIIFGFVILTFVIHITVASFISLVMYHLFVEINICVFTISVLHMVAYSLGVIVFEGCSIISSGCLGLVTSLLWKESA